MGNECTRLEKEKKKKMLVPRGGEGDKRGRDLGEGGGEWGNLERRRIKLERKDSKYRSLESERKREA